MPVNSLTLHGIEFTIQTNVVSYIQPFQHMSWNIQTRDLSSDTQILYNNVYLILDRDNEQSNAFGHWVLESCIFVLHYSELKKIYPTLKVVLKDKRDFKILFLKYLGIHINDIVYSLEPNNTCIFPPCFYLGTTDSLPGWHMNLIKDFMALFHKETIEKTIPFVLLPRQKKENYIGNDRTFPTKEIENYILDLDSSSVILNTDTITDLSEQINTIQRADIVVVTSGSPATVNSIFANNSKYIILGKDDTYDKLQTLEILKYIINICEKEYNNKIIFSNSLSLNDFIEALKS